MTSATASRANRPISDCGGTMPRSLAARSMIAPSIALADGYRGRGVYRQVLKNLGKVRGKIKFSYVIMA